MPHLQLCAATGTVSDGEAVRHSKGVACLWTATLRVLAVVVSIQLAVEHVVGTRRDSHGSGVPVPFLRQERCADVSVPPCCLCLALVPLALLLSSFLADAGTANSVGFGMFVFATILQAARNVLFERDASGGVIAIRSVLRATPFYALAKGMFDLGEFSDHSSDTGMRWRDIGSYAPYTLLDCLWTLALNFVVCLAATVVLEPFMDGEVNTGCCARTLSRRRSRPGSATDKQGGTSGGHVGEAEGGAIHGTGGTDHTTVTEMPVVKLVSLRKEFVKCGCGWWRSWWPGCGRHAGHEQRRRRCRESAFVAVHDVSLVMRHKELFCVLGSNGAGKTVTMSMLVGLLRPTHGAAVVCGRDVQQHSSQVRSMMGVCHQRDTLWDRLTAAEHVELYAMMRGWSPAQAKEEAMRRLKQVSLDGAATLQAGAMSGGMRRRLSLAMALAGDPAVVLLDEPTTGMDPVSRHEVWEVLKIERRRRCVILITHDMEEAEVLSDRLCIMHEGRVRCQGSPLQLKRRFGQGFTVTLVSTAHDISSLARVLERLLPFSAATPTVAPMVAAPQGEHLAATGQGSTSRSPTRAASLSPTSAPVATTAAVTPSQLRCDCACEGEQHNTACAATPVLPETVPCCGPRSSTMSSNMASPSVHVPGT